MNGRAYYLMILAKEKFKAAGSLLRMRGVERAKTLARGRKSDSSEDLAGCEPRNVLEQVARLTQIRLTTCKAR